MQIVIDISEQIYNRICVMADIDGSHILKAIKNGTVLSEGHDRLNSYRNAYIGVCPNCKVDVISRNEVVECWNCGMQLKLEKYRGDEE